MLHEIRGKHIDCYTTKWDGKSFISYGEWLAAPREMKYFTGKRLLMRQVLGKKLNTTILEDDFIIDQSVFIAKPLEENLKYIEAIQGLLASKLIAQYFKFTNNEFDALFPKIKIGEFKELPVFKDLKKAQSILEDIVSQILKIKKLDPFADTIALETKVDDLVYQLYNLTENEIKIIEQG